ncbi:hypothetical protein GCM10010399_56690 [Dactylosporangium fulvum]|uniref:DUF4397 domain-containing protein n=1 Tax=Dactylosporangium fulvum TaxID=53359 RepID=A0ABY5VYM1_9ACTN|nr:DUF4397 domain-containing protein [Dactylosporangium fulvum]UWP80861.1 DUF4397 domain-containing protein [Dactylosporangium fulvum]
MTVAPPRRRLAAFAAMALVGIGLAVVDASPAAAAGVGYVRLAHLSPDTPAVDVYLSSVSGAVPQQKFPAVGYGVVSKYLPLPPGTYAVAMRSPGAAADSAPILSAQATVEEGKAYTVAGVGRFADLGLRVIVDDLGLPDAGKAKVRVVQASVRQPVLDVAVSNGTKIADGVQFATTTSYQTVDPGRWTLRLSAPDASASATTVTAPLKAGSVYSLIVLDGKNGLTAQLRTDASSGGVPAGGVDTGGGGTADEDRGAGAWLPIGAAAALLLAVAGGLFLRRARMRARS